MDYLCPLVVNNAVLIDGHHRYEAIKDFCTETLVYVVKDNDMEKLLSKLNSYIWFDHQGKLMANISKWFGYPIYITKLENFEDINKKIVPIILRDITPTNSQYSQPRM
jgi:hypothetical protein